MKEDKYSHVRFLKQMLPAKIGDIKKISKSDMIELIEEGYVEEVEVDNKNKIVKKKSKRKLAEEKEEENNKENPFSDKKIKKIIRENYELIKEVIVEYSDLDERYVPILSAWIIGTYTHKSFEAYPYLFINAMKGSGKTRLLKLIAKLSNNGEVTNSLSEAVLFRTGKDRTLCIDEFENLGNKEGSSLRELLNSAYKKGAKVKRMRKKKTPEGEDYVVEEFEIYFPIAMANIWGMEEVLGDRCITILLDKSHKPEIVKLIENYGENDKVNTILFNFQQIKCSLNSVLFDSIPANMGILRREKAECSKCSVVSPRNVYTLWNKYIKDKYIKHNITTLTTLTTLTTNTTLHYTNYIDLFNKIDNTKIDGRNLELSFSLFLIGYSMGFDVLNEILDTMGRIVKERNEEESVESRDVTFLRFISSLELKDFISTTQLTNTFKIFYGDDEIEEKWINNKWVGRALKRLRLIIDKRRHSKGIEVKVNIGKAKEKVGHYNE